MLYDNRHPPEGIEPGPTRIAADEIDSIGGIRVTTAARTALDLACRLPPWISRCGNRCALARHQTKGRRRRTDRRKVPRPQGNIRRARRPETVDARCGVTSRDVAAAACSSEMVCRRHKRRFRSSTSTANSSRWLDMGWAELKIAVEYDGDQHWTDRRQLTRDIRRTEFSSRPRLDHHPGHRRGHSGGDSATGQGSPLLARSPWPSGHATRSRLALGVKTTGMVSRPADEVRRPQRQRRSSEASRRSGSRSSTRSVISDSSSRASWLPRQKWRAEAEGHVTVGIAVDVGTSQDRRTAVSSKLADSNSSMIFSPSRSSCRGSRRRRSSVRHMFFTGDVQRSISSTAFGHPAVGSVRKASH